MKGVILAGGSGTRLLPLTRVTNKHLLPVYDRPIVCFPLQQLVHAGLTEILIVTAARDARDFERVLGEGFEDMERRHPDTSKLRDLLDWEPQYDIDAIIAGVVEYYRSRVPA